MNCSDITLYVGDLDTIKNNQRVLQDWGSVAELTTSPWLVGERSEILYKSSLMGPKDMKAIPNMIERCKTTPECLFPFERFTAVMTSTSRLKIWMNQLNKFMTRACYRLTNLDWNLAAYRYQLQNAFIISSPGLSQQEKHRVRVKETRVALPIKHQTFNKDPWLNKSSLVDYKQC